MDTDRVIRTDNQKLLRNQNKQSAKSKITPMSFLMETIARLHRIAVRAFYGDV